MLAYTPSYPEAPPAAVQAEAPDLLDTHVGLDYVFRTQRVSLAGASVDGVVDNILAVQGQFRTGSFLFGAGAWRFKVPVNAPVLAATSNPALESELSEIRARAGYVLWPLRAAPRGVPVAVEVAPGVALLSQQFDPGGTGLPVTGTPWDYAQTRRGLGLEVPAVVAVGDRVEVELRASVFPYAGGRLEKAPYAFHEHLLHLVEGAAGLRIKLTGGLDAELSAGLSNWLGDVRLDGKPELREFRDLATAVSVGIVYRPGRVGR